MKPVAWVGQEDAHGCALAALAMVTSKTYAYVKQWFVERMPPDFDLARHGITHYPQDDYLTEHGFCTVRKCRGHYNVARTTGWPPEPFGRAHLCSVDNPGGGHMVVMLRDGTVLDPLTPTPTTLAAWGEARVNYVHAVYYVGDLPDGPSAGHRIDKLGAVRRANFLGAPTAFNLNQACLVITQAYGYSLYLVGSCLTKPDYRDVDVRLILDDADFDALFPRCPRSTRLDARWSLMCTAISEWLRAHTGLAIDFQIQRQSHANEDYPGKEHPRQAIGIFLHVPPADQPA